MLELQVKYFFLQGAFEFAQLIICQLIKLKLFVFFFALKYHHPIFVVDANSLNGVSGYEFLLINHLLDFVAVTALREIENVILVDGVVMVAVEFIFVLVECHAVKVML